MLKYIIDAILICIVVIWMTKTIDTFHKCIKVASYYQNHYIESLFEEAGL